MTEVVSNRTSGKKAGLSRAAMLGLFAVFLGPLVLASLWYANVEAWRPAGHVNHGELITPARPVNAFALHGLDGAPVSADELHGKWTFVHIEGARCDLQCEASLFKTRQAHQMLGKESDRVQRVFVLLSPESKEDWMPRLMEHPHMLAVTGSATQLKTALEAFGKRPKGGVYLLDPLGNLLMHYGDEATTKGMVKDLKRVLKVSQIG